MGNAIEGDLGLVEIPDLLTFVNMGRRTGVLILERTGQETRVFFRDGNPIYASTTRPELRLGRMLRRIGRVGAEDLERVARQCDGKLLGQALVSEKILAGSELESFVKVQVSEIIFATFASHEGRFAFADKVSPPEGAITFEISLPNLIMEGVRRIDERGRLSEQFPDLDMIADLATNPDRVKRNFTLTPEEWRVLFLVDGRRSLSEICRLAGNPEEVATLQILRQLHAAKIINVVPRSAASEGAADAEEAEVEGTQIVSAGASRVSVELRPELPPPSQESDTQRIVSAKAVPYSGGSGTTRPSWLVLVGDRDATAFPLTRDSHTLGRHRNNDIVISDSNVSGFHARIDRTAEGFVLVDLQSRNGCFVNGQRASSTALKTGDELRLGATRLRYEIGARPTSGPASSAPSRPAPRPG